VTDTVQATSARSFTLPAQPYPGLRPFDPDEHRIFFGREEMIEKVIDGLATKNLVVVHGASGSGKSSLVRAGVLPWLAIQQRGRCDWLTGICRPAGGPLRNLASVLGELLGPPSSSDRRADAMSSWHLHLALGPTVLREIEAALSGRGASLCLLIDQFEELFRYAKQTSHEEAELLTQLLCSLAGEGNPAPHLFVIVTMRSDYLGECARFDGFAETVNDCQYLLPRLDDFGVLRAIHEPATLYGGTIDPGVGDRLLFTARQEEDSLPILQHTLMRASAHSRRRHGSSKGWTVTIADLQAVEGKNGALSKHADEVLAEIKAANPVHLKAAEWLFRSLTELDAEGRVIRRPRGIAELISVAGDDHSGVIAVIETFRRPGCNFLMTSPSGTLTETTEVDVSHEALIRKWRQLSDPARDPVRNEPIGWVLREFEDGQRWRALAVQARVFRHDKSATLTPATTEAYESWWPEHSPAWAARYARDRESAAEEYKGIEDLWRASKEVLQFQRTRFERERASAQRRFKRLRRIASVTIMLTALLTTIFGVIAVKQRSEAVRERDNVLVKQSLFLADLARRQRAEGDAGSSLLLALEGLPGRDAITRPLVPEAQLQLVSALLSLRELIVLAGHKAAVRTAVYSPDGRRVLTASDDGTARLWDSETGKPAGEPLIGHTDGVFSASFSPDGRRIVTASADSTVRLWDSATSRPIGEPLGGHEGPVNSVAFSPDGKQIVTASDDKMVRLWDSATGQLMRVLSGHEAAVYSASSAPTVGRSSVHLPTRRPGCGIVRAASSSLCSPAMTPLFTLRHSAPMAGGSSQRLRTKKRGCGIV